jgi:hypothetical protein
MAGGAIIWRSVGKHLTASEGRAKLGAGGKGRKGRVRFGACSVHSQYRANPVTIPPPDYQPEWTYWGFMVMVLLWGAVDLYHRWKT